MKRRIWIVAIIALLIPGSLFAANAAGKMLGVMKPTVTAGSCTKADVPNGNIYKESFEDSGYDLGACGTGQCWTGVGSPDPDYSLTGLGTATNQNCAYGLRTNSTGSLVYSSFHLTSGLAEVWRKFSFYVVSHGLANGDNVTLACISTGADCTGQTFGTFRINLNVAQLRVTAIATGSATYNNVSTGTWYYVTIHGFDIGNCTGTDSPYVGCTGTGTGNYQIWIGTTYNGTDVANGLTYAGTNTIANPDEFGLGVFTASRTVNVIFGHDAASSNNTW